ncbi:hypothetical protein ACH5RR_028918 [Cinchona calisaya]|uniref:Wound-responsive family protein n=1 Tax=Cinchona calisaya TaxID=153742 RepID=A0ABD2YQ63_9GENT
MSSTSRAWIAALSVGAVHAMKEQGLCRWNYTIRSMHQHVKNNIGALAQSKQLSSAVASTCKAKDHQEKLKESEESLRKVIKKMSSTSRAAAAVCVGAVQAMKDQGLCRWNYTLRSLQQHAKNNIGSLSQSSKQLSSSVASTCKAKDHQENLKKSEESLRKVMYLSCWGPN